MSSTGMITRCVHDLPALPRRSCHACSSMINELRNPTLSPWKLNLIHNAVGCLLLSLACFRTLSHSHTFMHTQNHANSVVDCWKQSCSRGKFTVPSTQELAPDVAKLDYICFGWLNCHLSRANLVPKSGCTDLEGELCSCEVKITIISGWL